MEGRTAHAGYDTLSPEPTRGTGNCEHRISGHRLLREVGARIQTLRASVRPHVGRRLGFIASFRRVGRHLYCQFSRQATAPDFAPTACIRRLLRATGGLWAARWKYLRRKVKAAVSEVCKEWLK